MLRLAVVAVALLPRGRVPELGGAVLSDSLYPPESRSPVRVEGICVDCLEQYHLAYQSPAEHDAGPWGLLCVEHWYELIEEWPTFAWMRWAWRGWAL